MKNCYPNSIYYEIIRIGWDILISLWGAMFFSINFSFFALIKVIFLQVKKYEIWIIEIIYPRKEIPVKVYFPEFRAIIVSANKSNFEADILQNSKANSISLNYFAYMGNHA